MKTGYRRCSCTSSQSIYSNRARNSQPELIGANCKAGLVVVVDQSDSTAVYSTHSNRLHSHSRNWYCPQSETIYHMDFHCGHLAFYSHSRGTLSRKKTWQVHILLVNWQWGELQTSTTGYFPVCRVNLINSRNPFPTGTLCPRSFKVNFLLLYDSCTTQDLRQWTDIPTISRQVL